MTGAAVNQFGITFEFEKADTTGSYVRGWAIVATVDGQPVVDWQGDVVQVDDLRKAAHQFISDARVAKAMHRGEPIGEVVESIIIDDDLAKALQIGDGRRGWFIGMQVHSEAVRKRVRSGELRAFSIGGRGKRQRIE